MIELLKSNEIGEAVFTGVIDIGLSKLTSTRELNTVMLAQEPLQLIAPIAKRNMMLSPFYSRKRFSHMNMRPIGRKYNRCYSNLLAIKQCILIKQR